MAMLTDPRRSQVLLVTLPEETPVDETVETAFALEDEVGVALGPIVVNGVYDPVPGLERVTRGGAGPGAEARRAAAALRRSRTAAQNDERRRLAGALPLEQLVLPFLFTPTVGPAESERLAEALLDAIVALAGHAVHGG